MSVLDRSSQPYIAEHSLHGSMSTGELSGLYDDADVNSMQGTPISAHPSKKGILDDSEDEVELKDIDAEFVYNNRNVSRERRSESSTVVSADQQEQDFSLSPVSNTVIVLRVYASQIPLPLQRRTPLCGTRRWHVC